MNPTGLAPHAAGTEPQLVLRQATVADAEFAVQVIRTTMQGHVLRTWGHWNEPGVRERAIEDTGAGRTHIIELDGQAAGLFLVDERPTHTELEQIFLLPPFQRRGLGTRLMRELMAQADRSGRTLRLQVLRVNPARFWYSQLGLREVEQSDAFLVMAYDPPRSVP